VACNVSDEAVLLDTEAGLYFGLDPVGARIWAHITAGLSMHEICSQLEEEFEVARGHLESDVAALLSDLAARRLIEAFAV